jgi:hypothetical protein
MARPAPLLLSMRITNIHKLPQPFVDLVSEDSYNKGEAQYSTTQLIGPPKVSVLFSRHHAEVVEDASDRVWTMSGTAKHYVLEQIAKRNPSRYIVEKRMYLDVDGIKVGGQIDLYDSETETLYDWKESGVWKALSDDKFEWTAQGNINKLLCEANGVYPKKLCNIIIMKDWKLREAKIKPEYPQCAIQSIELPIWKPEETLAYIKSRIAAHEAARASSHDDEIPHCSERERWQREDVFAVLKTKDAKRAVSGGIYNDYESAKSHASKIGGVVEERRGEPTRCLNYCRVRQWCNFGKTLTKE